MSKPLVRYGADVERVPVNPGITTPTRYTRELVYLASDVDPRLAALVGCLGKIEAWLTKQAVRDEEQAKNCRFNTLTEAYLADAKNYRAVVKDIEAALAQEV